MANIEDEEFWKPRRCLREPIPDIFHAAFLLDRAVGAHLAGDRPSAERLIREANMPSVRAWTESLWGKKAANPDQYKYFRFRLVPAVSSYPQKEERTEKRMPTSEERRSIIERYGRNCVFCGTPLISKGIQTAIRLAYPTALPWGDRNADQHAAFQCMWMQFDHVLPHSRGGDNSIENVVVTCAPCNYGRGERILEELGLIDPRTAPIHKTSWDGLERFSPARI
ncbi:HNH endonuclease [Mycobacterium sp. KBS0706]|uniref:HNH endonuclease n=1 Tax=Mycobacterium sp. KBS0706 TaxID=2578109 RepID=UPI00110FD4B3|nr:HNH endonuclease [Mycobacterium sp. KBS0706]TSD90183.1 HNH endonuclease [Mycobacterium sp. KBS0706]